LKIIKHGHLQDLLLACVGLYAYAILIMLSG